MPKLTRAIMLLLLVSGATSLVFMVWPGADLALSRLFGGADGFPLARMTWAEALRQLLMWSTRLLALATLVWMVTNIWYGSGARVNWRLPVFAMSTFVLGPWLLVNELFKSHWGRARPRDVAEFGGDAMFTPAWQIADQCAANCSFVSGEAGMSVATALLIGLLFRLDLQLRHLWLLGILALTGAGMRVVVGAHFASDAILSGLLCALITMVLYRAFSISDHRRPGLLRAIGQDMGLLRDR